MKLKTKPKIHNNHIYCEDCFNTMSRMRDNSVGLIITSPPYNTSRNTQTEKARDHHWSRYDVFVDSGTHDDYVLWTLQLFQEFDRVLEKDGVVLYNLNYGNDGDFATCEKLLDTLNHISQDTNFMIANIIVWKKNSALPNNVSANKCTRIWEFVFVLCRKDESKTFRSNKQVKSVSRTGQNYYTTMYNFIEAPNNDGSCNLNKATFSSELVYKLLEMYCNDTNTIVYDPFIGTGTTAVARVQYGVKYIGSELSVKQCEYAVNRISQIGG